MPVLQSRSFIRFVAVITLVLALYALWQVVTAERALFRTDWQAFNLGISISLGVAPATQERVLTELVAAAEKELTTAQKRLAETKSALDKLEARAVALEQSNKR